MARTNERTDLIEVLEVMEVEGKPLAGKRICVTGHMAKPRKEIHELISNAGGEVHGSIKYNTTHLISNADWNKGSVADGTSSKLKKARQYGVKIISEEQFLAMLTSS